MKIVVTGAAGFIGRPLVQALIDRGNDVLASDWRTEGLPDKASRVDGNIAEPTVRSQLFEHGCDALIHLATIPGGSAEADPALSRRVNLDATYDLLLQCGERSPGARVVYTSTIAALGRPLPTGIGNPPGLSPRMIYGGHKAMIESAVAMFSNRSIIQGISLRMPGILGRPQMPSGLKSAFLSKVFYALRAGEEFRCPISPSTLIWVQSLSCCISNILHALAMDRSQLDPTLAVTLPPLRLSMEALVEETARQCGVSASLVRYDPSSEMEAAFAACAPIPVLPGETLGFRSDDTVERLVSNTLASLR